uniref:Fibronectin type-III domain-containing protein n=1 Tax=Branchiostoma floridae TaxID=7739 RepID=C3YP27_BRAFL|eukprot:XP_002601906.1 hypothetical protein BRAFLDRAFT_86390 [Branchiostoma floridae]
MAAALMNNNVGKTGLSGLFPPRRKEDSLHDHVSVLMQRVKNDFFKDMDDEQLRRLPDHVRPRVPVTEQVYEAFVTKSVRCRLRKLVHAYEAEEAWGTDFREKLDKPKAEGGFGTMEATLKEAERLWREYSPAYRPYRSVAKPGKLPDGRLNIRRTRLPEDSESSYRRRLQETREAAAAEAEENNVERIVREERIDQSIVLWQTLRPAFHALGRRLCKKGEAARELQAEGVRQEMACHVDGYTPPRNATDAMMDRVLLEFQRQLLNTELQCYRYGPADSPIQQSQAAQDGQQGPVDSKASQHGCGEANSGWESSGAGQASRRAGRQLRPAASRYTCPGTVRSRARLTTSLSRRNIPFSRRPQARERPWEACRSARRQARRNVGHTVGPGSGFTRQWTATHRATELCPPERARTQPGKERRNMSVSRLFCAAVIACSCLIPACRGQEIPNNGELDVKRSFTILLFAYHLGGQPMLDYRSPGAGTLFWIWPDRQLYIDIQAPSSHGFHSASNLPQGQWMFLGVTYDYATGQVQLWRDGINISSTNFGQLDHSTANPIKLAVSHVDLHARPFNGKMSCLQIYNYALSKQEIWDAQNACNAVDPPMNLDVTDVTDEGFKVTWSPSVDPDLQGYRVVVSGLDMMTAVNQSTAESAFPVVGLSPETGYVIRVTALFSSDGWRAQSEAAMVLAVTAATPTTTPASSVTTTTTSSATTQRTHRTTALLSTQPATSTVREAVREGKSSDASTTTTRGTGTFLSTSPSTLGELGFGGEGETTTQQPGFHSQGTMETNSGPPVRTTAASADQMCRKAIQTLASETGRTQTPQQVQMISELASLVIKSCPGIPQEDKDLAVGVLMSIASNLDKLDMSDPATVQSVGGSLVESVGSLLEEPERDAEEVDGKLEEDQSLSPKERAEKADEKEQENLAKRRSIVQKSRQVLDGLFNAILGAMRPGGPPVTIERGGVALRAQRIWGDQFGGQVMQTESGSFRVPSKSALFGDYTPHNVAIRLTQFQQNPLTWGRGEYQVRSSVMELSLLQNDIPVAFNNLTEDFNITIPGSPGHKPATTTITFPAPGNQSSSYHLLNLTNTAEGFLVTITPLNTSVVYGVWGRYGGRPDDQNYNVSTETYVLPEQTYDMHGRSTAVSHQRFSLI